VYQQFADGPGGGLVRYPLLVRLEYDVRV